MKELTEMSVDELLQRQQELAEDIPEEKRDAMTTEEIEQRANDLEAVKNELEARKQAAAKMEEIRKQVAEDTGIKPVAKFEEERKMEFTTESKEYRSGFLKELLGQELSAEERSAVDYVATTGDTTHGAAYVLPRQMLDNIWDLIDEQHAILADIDIYRTGTILEIAKRTSISQGDAAGVNENAANDDEINEFAKVTLTGKDFSKHVDISYAMSKMAVDTFESFLTREIADRMGAALAADILTQINSDYDSSHNAVSTGTALKIAFTDVAGALAVLKNAKGQCTVYGSHATIYKYLVGMVDTTGRPIFQVDAQEGREGTLIGCPVKVEDGISGDVLWIGYPKQVVGNMVQDIMVESDRDIKKHVITYAGYARFECKLIAPAAFAKLTVSPS